MLSYFPFLTSGVLAGAITGILGSGGGLILVPLLARFCHVDSSSLFPTSLSIMLPICFVSIFFAKGSTSFATVLPFLLGSTIGGMLALPLCKRIPIDYLRIAFSILLLWGGIRLLK